MHNFRLIVDTNFGKPDKAKGCTLVNTCRYCQSRVNEALSNEWESRGGGGGGCRLVNSLINNL